MQQLLLLRHLADQNTVLGNQTDEGDETDLGVDVHGGHAPRQGDQRATDGQRHRHHDDQRVTHGFELDRQHQEDDGQGQGEGGVERIPSVTNWRASP